MARGLVTAPFHRDYCPLTFTMKSILFFSLALVLSGIGPWGAEHAFSDSGTHIRFGEFRLP